MEIGYLKKSFEYFIKDKKNCIKYSILSLFAGVLELFGIVLIYPFIIKLLSQNSIDIKLIIIGLSIVLAFLAKNLFMILFTRFQMEFVKGTEFEINKKFMEFFIKGDYCQISRIPLSTKQHILGFLIPKITNDFFVRVFNLNTNIFITISILSLLVIKFFFASIVTIVFAGILLSFQTAIFKSKIKQISTKLMETSKKLNLVSNESLLNLKNLKIMNIEEFYYNKYQEKLKENTAQTRDLLFYNGVAPYITEPCIIILLLLLLSIILVENHSNTTTLIASYSLIVASVFRLAPTISRIQVNITGLNSALPNVKALVEYYEEFSLNQFKPTIEPLTDFYQSIEFKNVSFSYDEKEILKNINFVINKGEFVGIVGKSGVGKTTLIDILAGLLKINSGEIYIDNRNINTKKLPKLKIGYIPQSFTIMSGSIRENVALGYDKIDDEKVILALKQAQLYDFILNSYDKGIYAQPFTDSEGFSQGQKQRIAIARALYNNPDILILDEATSSLDLQTEKDFCEVLNSLKGEKTIIAIAHRLSTIKNSDKILFMQNSTISDINTFQNLITTNPDFEELVKLNNTNFVQ
jgi:ATP-binding cassette subfamily C protein